MDKLIEVLEKNHSIKVLIALTKKDKMFYSELKSYLDIGGNTSIRARLDLLEKTGFINDETEERTSKGRYVGVKRYIWLTDKGRQVAEKLVEIEGILDEK